MLSNLRYTNDMILLEGSEEELQELVNQMYHISCKWSLFITAHKTKEQSATSNSKIMY